MLCAVGAVPMDTVGALRGVSTHPDSCDSISASPKYGMVLRHAVDDAWVERVLSFST